MNTAALASDLRASVLAEPGIADGKRRLSLRASIAFQSMSDRNFHQAPARIKRIYADVLSEYERSLQAESAHMKGFDHAN